MSDSLWSAAVRPKVLSPSAILRAQAEALANQTNGLLLAELTNTNDEEDRVLAHFDIIVPALGNYRHRLFNLAYKKGLPYPVLIITGPPSASQAYKNFMEHGHMYNYSGDKAANNEKEFRDLLANVLQSQTVTTTIEALLARVTDELERNE